MSQEEIRVGCLLCKRTAKNEKLAKAAQKSMEEILDYTYNFLQNRAAQEGYEVPKEFREKIFKWARKAELIPDEIKPEAAEIEKK
jgi:hypothetical protein